jgi:Cellulose binding domain
VRRPVTLVLTVVLAVVLVATTGLAEAAFTTHESNLQTFTAGSFENPVDLVAQSRTNDGGASGTQIQYGLRLTNVGGERIDLRTVTVRYWFTADGSTGEPIAACYNASFGCGKLDQSVTGLPDLLDDADHYSEVGFANGKLDPGESAALDQLALRDAGGATYRQDNDYSFLGQDSFTDNPHVTVYVDGQLAWGTEPGPVARVESVQVQYSNLDSDPLDDAVKPGLKVLNTGTVDIDLRRLSLRYWFTAEGADQLTGFCDFAEPGCAKVTTGFGAVDPARPGADTYLEVGFTAGTVQAGGTTGQLQFRVHASDFSPFDERDDYSRGTNTSFATTTTVTAYLDGTLAWGTEP